MMMGSMLSVMRYVRRIVLPAAVVVMAAVAPALIYRTTQPVVASATGTASRMGVASRTVAAGGIPYGRWTNLAPLPSPRDRPAVAVGRDRNIYAFGGFDNLNGYNVYNTTYIYHPALNRWTRGADMAVAREGAQAVALPDGRLVVLGGSPGCPNSSNAQLCYSTNRVDVYDPRANAWATLAPLRTPRYRFNAVWRLGHIYAMGGLDGTRALSSVEAYDPRANAWHPMAGLPRRTEGAAAVADASGRIYLMGGAPGGLPFYDTLSVYDGAAWTPGAVMPRATQDYAAAYGADGKIYAFGGWNEGDLTAVQVYDPRADSWSLGTPLPAPLCCMGAAATPDGLIYAVGGDTTNGRRLLAYRLEDESVVAHAGLPALTARPAMVRRGISTAG